MRIASIRKKELLLYNPLYVVKKSGYLILNTRFFYLFDFTTLAAVKKNLNN